MNLREANLEAQRRWGPGGCAWTEASGFDDRLRARVGIITPMGQMTIGLGKNWDDAFVAIGQLAYPGGKPAPPVTDEQIRDMGVPSPDMDPKYRIAVERVHAAVVDARKMLGVDLGTGLVTPEAVAQVVAIAGFILTERARP